MSRHVTTTTPTLCLGESRLILHIQDGPCLRCAQPSFTVAPDESMVTYLRSMLGSAQPVWTE